ncbi:MAG: hypothetical protein EA427_14140 [Spirochaetaceae bacterium]|nr:MAG: hypothetical protein EA427_14140 [Spirochaetaceae bacterium]
MPESSIIRFLSVMVVLSVVGFGWYYIGFARLKRKGMDETAARKQANQEARKYSLIATFLYMVAMVSVVGLFL